MMLGIVLFFSFFVCFCFAIDGVDGGASADCFRGYELGQAYHYDLTTDLFFEKSHISADAVARSRRQNLRAQIHAVLTPVAGSAAASDESQVDESGALHLQLGIEAAHIVDLEGWQAYDGDGDSAAIDPTAADAQLLELLQREFYFTMHCDMHVSDVHYPDDEQKFALNIKNLLVSSFSHKLLWRPEELTAAGGARYTRDESDLLGDKTVHYEHTSSGADQLQVVSGHDEPRPIAMAVKGVSSARDPHHVDLDHHEQKRTAFSGGVVTSLHLEQSHQFPGKNTRDEMAADAAAAENVRHADADALKDSPDDPAHTDRRDERDERFAAASNNFRMKSGGQTRITLRERRKRRMPAAEPRAVRSFRHYASERHGGEITFVTSKPHTLMVDIEATQRVRTASDDARSVAELAALTNDGEEGHSSWRNILHRLDGSDREATLQELRRLLLESDDEEVPQDARQHLMSLLSEHGGVACEALLLDVAEAAEDMSADRHAALFALSQVAEPSRETTERMEHYLKTCGVTEVLCSQLLLSYGAMASTLHHAGQPQRAHNMRELLFIRLDERASANDVEGATVVAIAMNNTMAFVDDQDEALYNVTIGHWLNSEWGQGAKAHLDDGEFLGNQFAEAEWQRPTESAYECDEEGEDCKLRKRAMAPASPMLSLDSILGGKTGTSGWKKWYEGWSVSSRKNEYLPNGGIDQYGQNWGLPSDKPGEPQYGLNGLGKDGKARSKGFLSRCNGKYKDGTPCSTKHYDNWAPRNPDKGFKKKLGSGKFYAMIEAALHKRATGIKNKKLFLFDLDFFAGAQFSASLMGKKVPILSAYARANVSISDEREKCSYFDIGLFYYYFGKMFFWGIGSTDCQYVDSTCKPWFPVDRSQQGYIQFAHKVFFELTFTFPLGPIPMVVFIEGVGGAGMYWSVDMIFAPALKDKHGNECGGIDDGGGCMVNGFCEPEAYVSLAAELGIGIPVLSAGIGIQVDIIRVSLPASAGLNFVTQRPCFGIGVSVGALGGKIYLWARIGLCKGWIKICIKLKKTIYDWKGLTWEKPILRKDCCKPCPGACNNAWCDYKHGKCVCNDEWGGELCNMNCPYGCKDIETINPGVKCMINPDPNAHGELCECKEGYYGWNCLVPCPGLRQDDPEPRQICSGHGQCGDFGYQQSTGFGIDPEVENTLVAACTCDKNYFGERCDITCEADPETGRVCGGGGGVCVFDGQQAFCQCLKGYAGPECKARCPLFRGSPCGFRGDCIWEDGRATCHCHLGFSGEGCEKVDELGGGRALRFVADDLYYMEIADASRLRAPSDQYTIGLWFRADALPQGIATLLTWRWGRVLLAPDEGVVKKRDTEQAKTAALIFCDARSVVRRDGCIQSPISVPLGSGEWQFVFVTVSSYQLAHDKQLWHGIRTQNGGCAAGGEKQPAPFNQWCVADVNGHENTDFSAVKGTLRVGMNFTGLIDNIEIFSDRPTTAVVNERAHHQQAPEDSNVLFAALCDEGRGDTIYDERGMLSGRFVFPDTFDWLAAGPEHIWGNPSGVQLINGAIYSNSTDTFDFGNGTTIKQWFHTDMRAARIKGAKLHMTWAVPSDQLCEIRVKMLSSDGPENVAIVDENGRTKKFNGDGVETVTLTPTQVSKMRAITEFEFSTSFDNVRGQPCIVTLDEVFVEVESPVADPMLEFTGRPSAFAATTNHKRLKLPFTIEMWLIRPPLLRSNRGLLMALVDKGANATLAAVDGPFLLYETGFPALGMQYRYEGQTRKVLAGGHDDAFRYVVPSDEWVHFAVTVEPSPTPGKCLHTFLINGQVGASPGVGSRNGIGERLDYPGPYSELNRGDKPNYCNPTAFLQGWGNPNFELRIGSKFLGAINDVIIWSRAVSPLELRQNMHRGRNFASLNAGLHAWDFSGVRNGPPRNEPVLIPDKTSSRGDLTMRDGAHLGLVVALEHEWRHCPGVTYQLPEAVCGSEPTHAHGKCIKPRGTRDRRGDDGRDREKGYECECYDGYRSGLEGACALECPGGHANPCSGHGKCVGAIAPIEAWEQADGTENTSYVDPANPNVHDRRQTEEVLCVCDEGYVGQMCEFECPGWSEPWNRPQRICSGYGFCNYTISGGATCQCFDSSQRYGDACEFAYGSEPDKVVSECGPCDGANEACVDTYCTCNEGYYRVFGSCRPHAGEFDVEDNTTASFAAAFSMIAICMICFAAMAIVYFLKFRN